MNAEPFPISETTARLGSIAILWRGDEVARRSATADNSRLKGVFAALADVGVHAEPVVYEDDVLDAVRAQLATVDGVLVWVNPIHEGRNRAKLDALLREVAARGVWVSAHPDVILKMGTKEVLHRTRTMSWGSDTALYQTPEAMRAELPARLAAGPRVIKAIAATVAAVSGRSKRWQVHAADQWYVCSMPPRTHRRNWRWTSFSSGASSTSKTAA